MHWLFDVDGTLIGSIRSDRLRPGVPQLLDMLTKRNAGCSVWSAGGGDYARRKAAEHGIEHYFDGFYAKADRGPDGRYLTGHLAPEHRPTLFVDDVPNDLPVGARVVAVPQFFGGSMGDRAILDVVGRLDAILAEGDLR